MTRFLRMSFGIAAVLAASPSVMGAAAAQSRVVPGDTFNFRVLGTNPQQGRAVSLFGAQSIVFGTTQNYAYRGNQTLTVTSSETVNGLSTTDIFSFAVTTNFVPAGTQIDSNTQITGVSIDVGDSNTTGDRVDVLLPIGSVSSTATLYTASPDPFTFTPGIEFGPGNLSYDFFGNVYNTSNNDTVTPRGYNRFVFSFTYASAAAVPEPATWGVMIAGFAAVGGMLRRRRRGAVAAAV